MRVKKKLLFVMLGERLAGAERHVLMLLPELIKLGYSVSLLNLFKKNKSNVTDEYKNKLFECQNSGVKIYHYSVNHRFGYFSIKNIARLISEINPDVVHTHMIHGDLLGGIAAKIARIPIIVSTRHYDYSFSLREIIKVKAYYLFTNIFQDSIICVSNKIAELAMRYEKWPQSKIVTIPLGYSDEKVDKETAREKMIKELGSTKPLLIGSISRLVKIKGINYALLSAKILKDMDVSFKWIIVGDGPEKEKLIKLRRKLSLENEVIFLGQRNDVHEIIASLDILIHPTLAESFGLVILEAMIQSTPVITTITGALPEIIVNNYSGILVEPKRPDRLADAINRLILNPKEKIEMGKNGRLRFESLYALDRMVKKLSIYYDNLG